MKNVAFDNAKYLKLQSEHILERIGSFDNKLYLEFEMCIRDRPTPPHKRWFPFRYM